MTNTDLVETQAHLWDRREGESNRWYRRFEAFKLMGQGRSLLGAVNRERVTKGRAESQQTPGSWRNASKAWDWRARAEAWDQHLLDLAAAAQEAHWKSMIMGPSEVLARLSDQGRISIGDFLIAVPAPLRDSHGVIQKDENDQVIYKQSWEINIEMVKQHGHLIKSITFTRQGPKLELIDGQTALVQMGRHHKLFTDVQEHTGQIGFSLTADDLARAAAEVEQWERDRLKGEEDSP